MKKHEESISSVIWTGDSRIRLEVNEELNQCGKDFNLGGSLPLLKLSSVETVGFDTRLLVSVSYPFED